MSDPPVTDGWGEWRRYVLMELESNQRNHEILMATIAELDKKMSALQSEIAVLQVKAGVWGLIAGVLGTIGVILIGLLK